MSMSSEFLKGFFLLDPPLNGERARVVNIEGGEIHPGKFAIITQTREQRKDKIATRHLIESTEIEFAGPRIKSIKIERN